MVPASFLLAPLFTYTWCIPAMVEIARAQGCKVVSLAVRLGASRPALREALDQLTKLDLVQRNPGYGHPLRPEYILTPRGEYMAPAATALLTAIDNGPARELCLRKWSVPVLVSLVDGPLRFSRIASALPRVTHRALASVLKALVEAGLVARRVEHGHPPAVVYTLSGEAMSIATAGHALALTLREA